MQLYSTFLEQHLRAWLECVATSLPADSDYRSAIDQHMESIFFTGAETLFSLEGLRDKQLLQLLQAHPAFSEAVAEPPASLPNIQTKNVLPRLYLSYVHAVRRNRGPLFGGAAGGDREASVRAAGVRFFAVCLEILNLDDEARSASAWAMAAQLTSVLAEENLYRASDEESGETLTELFERAVRAIESSG